MAFVDSNDPQIQRFVKRMNQHLSTLRPRARLESVSIEYDRNSIETSFKIVPLENVTMLSAEAWNALSAYIEEQLKALAVELRGSNRDLTSKDKQG